MPKAQQHTNENVLTLNWGNDKIATLRFVDEDLLFDVEDILKIDYSNIIGEIITFPVLFNRIGNMRAEAESRSAEGKFDLEVFEAQLTEQRKKTLTAGGEKATLKDVESAVLQDVNYIAKKKKLLAIQKEQGYVDSLYWSAKSKDEKLTKLSEKLVPSELEKDLLEGSINGIMVKMHKKSIR